MIQYIMFNGNKYVPESELSEQERNQALRIVDGQDGLLFCTTGSDTRYYIVDKSHEL